MWFWGVGRGGVVGGRCQGDLGGGCLGNKGTLFVREGGIVEG